MDDELKLTVFRILQKPEFMANSKVIYILPVNVEESPQIRVDGGNLKALVMSTFKSQTLPCRMRARCG